MTTARPVWRSLLYVPTHVEKFVASAHTRGADAIILDLEDAVPPDLKAHARTLVRTAAETVSQAGADVIVRINGPMDLAAADIAAVVGPDVTALSLPKVDSVDQIHALETLVALAEATHGLPEGHTRLWVLIESAVGFLAMADIAKASPRIVAMTLGGEDFALDVGMEPGEDTLLAPKQQLIIAAAAAGVMPLGVIGGTTRFDDPDGYREMAKRSRRFGFAGSSAIHPSQVPLLNEAFSPSEAEIVYARRLVDAEAAAIAEGRGAFSIDGKMIDPPVVNRARRLLAVDAAIQARGARAQTPA